MIKALFFASKNVLMPFLLIGIFVLGLTGAAQADLANLALTGTATQSSTAYGGVAGRAIDGNTDGSYFHNSVSHTNIEAGAWWQVDLGDTYNIGKIVIWNRTDGWGDRINDFYVSILDVAGAPVWSSTHNATFPLDKIFAGIDVEGQYVKVGLHGSNYLQLAEVQVFAAPVPLPSAFLLLGPGLMGLATLRRRLKQ